MKALIEDLFRSITAEIDAEAGDRGWKTAERIAITNGVAAMLSERAAVWTEEWPREAGWYWCYRQDGELAPVRAHTSGSGSVVCVSHFGGVLHRDASRRLWRRMDLPEPPAHIVREDHHARQ